MDIYIKSSQLLRCMLGNSWHHFTEKQWYISITKPLKGTPFVRGDGCSWSFVCLAVLFVVLLVPNDISRKNLQLEYQYSISTLHWIMLKRLRIDSSTDLLQYDLGHHWESNKQVLAWVPPYSSNYISIVSCFMYSAIHGVHNSISNLGKYFQAFEPHGCEALALLPSQDPTSNWCQISRKKQTYLKQSSPSYP